MHSIESPETEVGDNELSKLSVSALCIRRMGLPSRRAAVEMPPVPAAFYQDASVSGDDMNQKPRRIVYGLLLITEAWISMQLGR